MLAKFALRLGFVGAMLLTAGSALGATVNMDAGPIWNNDDAKAKCPAACKVTWNGQWWTTVQGVMSVCQATNSAKGTGVFPVGPIWNNDDAKTKCPSGLATYSWNGQWWTTVPNQMSVCSCQGGPSTSAK